MSDRVAAGEVRDAWWGDASDEAELVAEQERDLQPLEEVEADIGRLPDWRRAYWRHTPAVELLNEGSRLRQRLRREAEGRPTKEDVHARTLALIEYLRPVDRIGGEFDAADTAFAKQLDDWARHERRQVAVLHRQRRALRAASVHAPQRRESVPAQRPRERRSRSRTRSAARGSPDDSGDLDPEPVAFVSGFTAASERLSGHLATPLDGAEDRVNLPRISEPPTSQSLRDRVLLQLAHANAQLSEAEKRRRLELLVRMRKERER